MTESLNNTEIADRLKLIETMMTEGRRKTESWGWTFVLWGIAYYVAICWAAFGSAALAWPVTMIAATVFTVLLSARQSNRTAATTLARAVGSIWTGMGVSLFLLLFSMGFSHRFEQHIFVAIVGAMLGSANATSGLLLRWKAQFACAIVWWAAAVVACFGSPRLVMIAFLVAIFLCQIVFGIYAMLRDARARDREARHA
ncbi:MAG: hypothetical protein P4L03_07530 [Terracidiphilus sp.]|nr:hypothetical protein [Terracidiphilus sp.]